MAHWQLLPGATLPGSVALDLCYIFRSKLGFPADWNACSCCDFSRKNIAGTDKFWFRRLIPGPLNLMDDSTWDTLWAKGQRYGSPKNGLFWSEPFGRCNPPKLGNGCATTANIPERIDSLRETTRSDGIHFNEKGNSHMANRAITCLKGLVTSPKKQTKKGTYFWRGFRSPNGSTLPRTSSGLAAGSLVAASRGAYSGLVRGRSRGYHPYRRW